MELFQHMVRTYPAVFGSDVRVFAYDCGINLYSTKKLVAEGIDAPGVDFPIDLVNHDQYHHPVHPLIPHPICRTCSEKVPEPISHAT